MKIAIISEYFFFVPVWEVATGRCIRIVPAGGVVRSVDWCPNQALALVAVAADRKILLINPKVGDTLVVAKTDALIKEEPAAVGVGKKVFKLPRYSTIK